MSGQARGGAFPPVIRPPSESSVLQLQSCGKARNVSVSPGPQGGVSSFLFSGPLRHPQTPRRRKLDPGEIGNLNTCSKPYGLTRERAGKGDSMLPPSQNQANEGNGLELPFLWKNKRRGALGNTKLQKQIPLPCPQKACILAEETKALMDSLSSPGPRAALGC